MWPPDESNGSSPRMSHTLLLFDVDGTLILSGGAGLRALNQTFHELFQVQDAFAGITTAGRTDGEIIDEAIKQMFFEGDELSDLFRDIRKQLLE